MVNKVRILDKHVIILSGSFNIETNYAEASSHKILIRQTSEFEISFPDISNIASVGKEISHPQFLI